MTLQKIEIFRKDILAWCQHVQNQDGDIDIQRIHVELENIALDVTRLENFRRMIEGVKRFGADYVLDGAGMRDAEIYLIIFLKFAFCIKLFLYHIDTILLLILFFERILISLQRNRLGILNHHHVFLLFLTHILATCQ